MVRCCQKNFTNLQGTHILIAGSQDSKGTRNKRRSHRRTTVAAILIISSNISGIAILARTNQCPVLCVTSLVKFNFQFVVAGGIKAVYLLQTSNSNPLRFSFWIEIRIECAMIRIGAIVIAVGEDLNDILSFHGIPSSIDKTWSFVVLFFEQKIFVFNIMHCSKFRTTVIVVDDISPFIYLF